MADRALEEQAAPWRAFPRERPANVEVPGPGQESVWDYPRPPRLETVSKLLRVEFAGVTVAETTRGVRVCETAGPPVYYFPPEDVKRVFLHPMSHTTLCEWKGQASYWTLSVRGLESQAAAWCYPSPFEGYEAIAGWFAFHAGRVDACYVGGERVGPQPGGYYGGWITSDIVGPFKGGPGTERW
ncbi:MAG: DUF427 domain-containing protein [Chloroflexota bacterium]|nr:DUF427 domain-containing protein [Chloroflexota bacterium]MDE2883673.1 DUF427 domain-containing protein [Chloroflexota bacterium]